jgi:dienelactone hydrolase
MTSQRGYPLFALIFSMVVLIGPAGSPLAAAAPFNAQPMTIPFTQPDGSTLQLSSLTLSPKKSGRFPLAVLNHGSPRTDEDRIRMAPDDLLNVGKWLVDRGYAVAIPMRRGYGHSQGVWAEGYGSCQNPDYVSGGRASAQDIDAVIRFMQGQGFVDASHVVLMGHSAGAWGSIAAASENPPGVIAAIAFAPGRGSQATGQCGGDALVAAAGVFGSTTRVPSLWVYSENDHFFSPQFAKSIFDAFHATTHATAEFVHGPSCGQDGHGLIIRCPDAWHSIAATFLQKSVVR